MATAKVSNKQQRDLQRAVHIVSGVLLMMYVYSPAGESSSFSLLIRVVVMPTLILSGMMMWQLPRLRKLLQGKSRGMPSQSGTP